MSKEVKKVKVFFDEASHHQEMTKTYEIVEVYKAAAKELETIIEKTIDNPIEFKNDPLLYSIAQIKLKYPAAFNLNLGLDKTMQMLGIDLRKLEQHDAVLKTTPHKIDVCNKTGNCTPNDDKEPFIWYAEQPEQLARLQFANELAALLERANEYTPFTHKANLTNGLQRFVYFEPQTEKITPHHYFVMNNGLQ